MRLLKKFERRNVDEIISRGDIDEMKFFITQLYTEYGIFKDDNAKYEAVLAGEHPKAEEYIKNALRSAIRRKFKVISVR